MAQAPRGTLAADHNDPIGVQAAYRSGESASGYEVDTNDPAADIADAPHAWAASLFLFATACSGGHSNADSGEAAEIESRDAYDFQLPGPNDPMVRVDAMVRARPR